MLFGFSYVGLIFPLMLMIYRDIQHSRHTVYGGRRM